MEDTAFWGTLSTLAGLLLAVAFFLLALWLVARARRGNRRVREARSDPHVAAGPPVATTEESAELAKQDRRDISQ